MTLTRMLFSVIRHSDRSDVIIRGQCQGLLYRAAELLKSSYAQLCGFLPLYWTMPNNLYLCPLCDHSSSRFVDPQNAFRRRTLPVLDESTPVLSSYEGLDPIAS